MPSQFVNATALHVSAAASLAGVMYWVFGFDAMGGALGFSGKALFNWHPVLMTAAFGVLLPEALLAFRSSSGLGRPLRKSMHGAMHTVAVVLAVLALVAVLRFHKEIAAPDLYSAHSYVGVAALVLLGLQYAAGVSFYALQLPSPAVRAALMPTHRALGKITYFSGVAALASGLMQKQSFLRVPGEPYSPVTVFANVLALLFLLTAGTVVFGLEPTATQREATSEGLGELREAAGHGNENTEPLTFIKAS